MPISIASSGVDELPYMLQQGVARPRKGNGRTWPAAISLRSSISTTLTAATSSIQMELAFGAGVAVEDESFEFCLFVTAITCYIRSDL